MSREESFKTAPLLPWPPCPPAPLAPMSRFIATCYKVFQKGGSLTEIGERTTLSQEMSNMSISDTQVFVALVVALIPGILAFRLATELYK